MRKIEMKYKVNLSKIGKFIGLILFILMLILIYIISPKITQIIQDIAKYLYEIEAVQITRVVELILSISFIIAAFSAKNDKK